MKGLIIFVFLALSRSKKLTGLRVGDTCTSGARAKGPCNNVTLTCNDLTNKCAAIGCRLNEEISDWPIGLPQPPVCSSTEYCPKSALGCLPRAQLGEICYAGRDDSCLGDNGVCLSQHCYLKDVPSGQSCIFDDVSFYGSILDNCQTGFFCSTHSSTCLSALQDNDRCSEDRQCQSGTCRNGFCAKDVDYNRFPTWAYIVIGIGCLALIVCWILFVYIRRRRRMNAYKRSVAELEHYRQSVIGGSNARNITSPSHEHLKNQSFVSSDSNPSRT
ncbi:Trihydroxynaphthalene reductase [Basidiobolus ranarum]|uniref:Trihydroxynaphthalene reductase n=1 Tax=Basidiobolus ranarum TaxID=34480 RepID=A0ABR2VUE6_9FUNG